MKRWTFNLATAVSLLIAVAAIVCDIASRGTTFGWTSHHTIRDAAQPNRYFPAIRNRDLVASNGVVYYMGEDSGDTRMPWQSVIDEHRILRSADLRGLNRDRTTYGFSWHDSRRTSGRVTQWYWQRSVPLGPVMVVAFTLPGLWMLMAVRRYVRAARAGAGYCPSCGYDLRATRERCPECGTTVPSKAKV